MPNIRINLINLKPNLLPGRQPVVYPQLKQWYAVLSLSKRQPPLPFESGRLSPL
jgi:hypothetical protein